MLRRRETEPSTGCFEGTEFAKKSFQSKILYKRKLSCVVYEVLAGVQILLFSGLQFYIKFTMIFSVYIIQRQEVG
jgi:hypothetical protein